MVGSGIQLRLADDGDTAFLESVYASTRQQELDLTDWSAERKADFCHQQFEAQTTHYQQYYPTAEFSIIETPDGPVGRLYVDRWAREIRIMDIAILPAHRGRGIGSQLLGQLQHEAGACAKILTIHVERMNPALALYQRLGFQIAEDKGVYLLMQWRPASVLR